MNKTQKNWRKYWKNYKPTENDRIYRSARRPRAQQIVIPSSIIIIIMIVLSLGRNIIAHTFTVSNKTKLINIIKSL